MRSGFLPARVVHVHPTRACNLACAHCYSDSSPQQRGELGVTPLLRALERLREEGYEIVSISGGEPFVYGGLLPLARGAAALGFRVHLITNGILVTEARLAALAPYLYLFGVSLDGAEVTHNAVRGRADAFRHSLRALSVLSKAGLPFGIVYAVTSPSLEDIPWAFELGRDLGARLLHLRPLAPEGRASSMASSWTLTHEDCERLALLAELLGSYGPPAPRVQVDLIRSSDLHEARSQFALLDPAGSPTSLSDAINPLVIDADGRCYPFSYGFDPSYVLGDLSQPITDASLRLTPVIAQALAALLDRAFGDAEGEAGALIDWFAHLTRLSRRVGARDVAPAR
jgi:MoaA/NifB/PqqE/SkfB family radical SAM enzyme